MLAILISVSIAVSTGLGWRIGAVTSDSMGSELRVWDAVVSRPVDPADIKLGDVIAFESPNEPNTIITHRVVGIVDDGGSIGFRTQGDANPTPDKFIVPAKNLEGEIILNVPYLGYLIVLTQNPYQFAILLMASVLAIFFIRKINLRLTFPTSRIRAATATT